MRAPPHVNGIKALVQDASSHLPPRENAAFLPSEHAATGTVLEVEDSPHQTTKPASALILHFESPGIFTVLSTFIMIG